MKVKISAESELMGFPLSWLARTWARMGSMMQGRELHDYDQAHAERRIRLKAKQMRHARVNRFNSVPAN